MKLLALLCAGAAVACAAPITYTFNTAVGAGSLSGTVQTDGTLGVLAIANIVDWNLVINDGSGSFNLLGPLSGNNSQAEISPGSGLSATATQLLFDFSSITLVRFQNPTIGSGINFLCIESGGGQCSGIGSGEALKLTGSIQHTAFSGTQVIATVADGVVPAVPEPATSVLIGAGFLVLAALRMHFGRG